MHRQAHQGIRRQTLPRIRRQAVRRLSRLARAARLCARQQDRHAARAQRQGGGRHRHQQQRHRRQQAARRPRDHLRRGRAPADRHLPQQRALCRQRCAFAIRRKECQSYRFQTQARKIGTESLPPLPHRRLSPQHLPHRQRRRLRQERIYRDDKAACRHHRPRSRQRQDGDMPFAALSI